MSGHGLAPLRVLAPEDAGLGHGGQPTRELARRGLWGAPDVGRRELADVRQRDEPLDDVELLAHHAPRAIYGIGLNYAEHVRETGGELPEVPIVFMKTPASAAAPGAPLR